MPTQSVPIREHMCQSFFYLVHDEQGRVRMCWPDKRVTARRYEIRGTLIRKKRDPARTPIPIQKQTVYCSAGRENFAYVRHKLRSLELCQHPPVPSTHTESTATGLQSSTTTAEEDGYETFSF
jgi:hypothetical protein